VFLVALRRSTQRSRNSAVGTAQSEQRSRHSAFGTAQSEQRSRHNAVATAQSTQRSRHGAVGRAQWNSAVGTAHSEQLSRNSAVGTTQSEQRSRHSAVGTVQSAQRSRNSESLPVGRSGVRSALLVIYVAPIQTDRGAQHSLPVQWTAGLSPGVKRAGFGVGHSHTSSSEFKHGWKYTAMPPCLPPVACYRVVFIFDNFVVCVSNFGMGITRYHCNIFHCIMPHRRRQNLTVIGEGRATIYT